MNNPTDTQIFTSASAIGLVAGMRTFAAPAIVGQIARRGSLDIQPAFLRNIGHGTISTVMSILSVGELIADKLPGTPNRTKAFPLIGRILSGSFCGAVLCASKKKSPIVGALAGAFGATGGTFATYQLRKMVTGSLGWPDPAVAIIEDAFAVGLGVLMAKNIA